MPRRLPQRLIEQLRPLYFLIIFGEAAAHVGDQLLEGGPAVGVPEDDARAFLLEVEQVHLATDLTVIALLRFFHLVQVGAEFLVLAERNTVHALQLSILRVTAPIGARSTRELECLADVPGGCHVRAAAQIHPFALRIHFYIFALGDGIDQLDLEQLPFGLEVSLSLFTAPDLFCERGVAGNDLRHPLLDLRQVLRQKRFGLGEIVEETIFDHRADRHLSAGPQLLHGFGEHVRTVVADQPQGFGVGSGDEPDRCVSGNGISQIVQLAIERHRHRAPGERGRNRPCNVKAGGIGRCSTLCPIGHRQDYFGHGHILSLSANQCR